MKVNCGVSSSRELHDGDPRVVTSDLLYTSDLGDTMRHHKVDFHLYADDTKLFLTFESSSADLAKLVKEDCVREGNAWATE